MATYVPSLQGYVTDVPEIWLKRADNKVFHFDQLSSSNVSPDTQFTEVTGGWSLYPVAYLPGQSTMEMTFESSQFDADLFALATNTEFAKRETEVWGSATVTADTDKQLSYVIESSEDLSDAVFYVNGLKPSDATSGDDVEDTYSEVPSGTTGNPSELGYYERSGEEGSYTYTLTEDTTFNNEKTYYEKTSAASSAAEISVGKSTLGTSGAYETIVTLASADNIAEGDQVVFNYCLKKNVDTIMVDNQQTFVGEAILRWPVYSSGAEIKAAGVKGYCMMHIFRCRCTAMPGFDTSYKSAVTNGITVSAMDPHRPDGAIYSISYVEK